METDATRKKRGAWAFPADLLIQVLVHEKMMDAAWAAVRRYDVSKSAQRDLAGASEVTHPAEALAIHTEHVEELATLGNSGSYAAAAKLIARMAVLRGKREQDAYVEELKLRHGRKRNFMKLLG